MEEEEEEEEEESTQNFRKRRGVKEVGPPKEEVATQVHYLLKPHKITMKNGSSCLAKRFSGVFGR